MRISRIATLVAVLFAALLGSTSTAGAAPCAPNSSCDWMDSLSAAYADQYPNFQGWGSVSGTRCTEPNLSSYCRTTHVQVQCFRAPCPALTELKVVAYRWSNSAWSSTSISSGTPAYIYPYATGWSWVWTQSTGWLAIRSGFAQTRADCGARCPL